VTKGSHKLRQGMKVLPRVSASAGQPADSTSVQN